MIHTATMTSLTYRELLVHQLFLRHFRGLVSPQLVVCLSDCLLNDFVSFDETLKSVSFVCFSLPPPLSSDSTVKSRL